MSKDKENDEISKISENQGDEEDEEANTSQNASFLPVTIEDCGSVADSYDAQTSFTSQEVIQPVEMLRFSSGTSEARSKVSYILSGTSEARSNVFFLERPQGVRRPKGVTEPQRGTDRREVSRALARPQIFLDLKSLFN
jgi:hypothetical protein